MKKDFAFYRKLFCSTFYLSAFTFGGGYVIIPLMRKKFVEQYHWIEEEEMLDLTAIAQSSPGAIAVNASILITGRLRKLIFAHGHKPEQYVDRPKSGCKFHRVGFKPIPHCRHQ